MKIPARFNPQLYIVGPGKKEADLFARCLKDDPFRSHAKRFQFRTYGEVSEWYQAGRAFDSSSSKWGIPFFGRAV